MLGPEVSPPEERLAMRIRAIIADRGGHVNASGARLLASLRPDHDGLFPFVPYEVLCERMIRMGYEYTSKTEIRDYARYARRGLRSANMAATIENANSMGYRLDCRDEDLRRAFGC